MNRIFIRLSALSLFLSIGMLHASSLSLSEALEILKGQNLEIKTALLDSQSAASDTAIARGYHFGSLDFTQEMLRSDDAGNVFGFKLSSREAAFKDFGFGEFNMANPDLLNVQPKDLNYPRDQNYFKSRLTYQVPLYTGGKLSAYENIAQKMEEIKRLDMASVLTEKRYEVRKSYYDMALLESSRHHLQNIYNNIITLEKMTQMMIKEGYAKKVDLLEVESKKANVERSLSDVQSHRQLLYHYLSFLLNQEVNDIVLPDESEIQSAINEQMVIDNNNDLKKASRADELRQNMIDLAYAPFLPQVGAFAEASSADNSFLGDFNDHKSYTVGAKLTWNLFNGGIDGHSLEKARIEKMKAKTQVELAKKGMLLRYHTIQTEIESFNAQIKSLEQELKLSNEIYQNYEGRYREHLVSMSDLSIKQSQQIEKVLMLQRIKNERNARIFALEKLSNGVTQ